MSSPPLLGTDPRLSLGFPWSLRWLPGLGTNSLLPPRGACGSSGKESPPRIPLQLPAYFLGQNWATEPSTNHAFTQGTGTLGLRLRLQRDTPRAQGSQVPTQSQDREGKGGCHWKVVCRSICCGQAVWEWRNGRHLLHGTDSFPARATEGSSEGWSPEPIFPTHFDKGAQRTQPKCRGGMSCSQWADAHYQVHSLQALARLNNIHRALG